MHMCWGIPMANPSLSSFSSLPQSTQSSSFPPSSGEKARAAAAPEQPSRADKGSYCTAPLGAAGKKEKNTATLFFLVF